MELLLMENELIKDIKGYEDLYAITTFGRVWSYKNQKFLRPGLDKDGYQLVNLCVNYKKRTFKVHRLVAEAFIPNPDGKPQVNHKDEVKTNNSVSNLEWATIKENVNHGTGIQRSAEKRKKKVRCIETNEIFASLCEAAEAVNGSVGYISKCCRGKQKTHKKLHWEYLTN